MKNILKTGLFAMMAVVTMTACEPQDSDDYTLGAMPDASQVSFTMTPGANPNIVTLKNTSSVSGVAVWDLGNGNTAKGDEVTASYPFANTYTVSMSLYTPGGSASAEQSLSIANNDESQINESAIILAGGLSGSKTWVFDRAHDGHFGVGPAGDAGPSWWACPAEGKAESSLYENEFTFHLDGGYNMTWTNKGKVYSNGAGAAQLPGAATVPPAGDYDIEYTPKDAYTFSIDGTTMKLSGDAFFGHYAGTSTYTILNLTENEFYVTCASTVESGNGWWYRFVPKQ